MILDSYLLSVACYRLSGETETLEDQTNLSSVQFCFNQYISAEPELNLNTQYSILNTSDSTPKTNKPPHSIPDSEYAQGGLSLLHDS